MIVLLDGAITTPNSAPPSTRRDEFASSEYAKIIHGVIAGSPPTIDLTAEKRLIDCLVNLASERAIVSAHDVSDGGLAVTIAESCFTGEAADLSAEITLKLQQPPGAAEKLLAEIALFGESGARAVVSLPPASLARVAQIAAQYRVSATRIGAVTRGEFRIQYEGASVIQGRVDSFRQVWKDSLGTALESA